MSEPIGDIPVKISGDYSALQQDLLKAEAIASAGAKEISEAFSGSALTGLEKFGQGIGDFLTNPLQSAQLAMGNLVGALGPIGVAASAAGAALGVLGKNITDLVLAEGAAAESTSNLANRLNLTFQETKTLSEMAQIAGVSIEGLSRVSMRLADALEDPAGAGKKVAEALDKMGINAADSGDALRKVLEKLAEIPDATERINKAHEIMGRGAVQLEPLLRNYGELKAAVESLGGQLSDDMVKKLLEADDAADKLSIAWSHLKENLAATFAPAVTAGLNMLSNLLSDPPDMKLDDQIKSLKQEVAALGEQAKDTGFSLSRMFAQSTGMAGQEGESGSIANTLKQAKEAQLRLLESQKEGFDRSKEYNKILDKLAHDSQMTQLHAEENLKKAKEASHKVEEAWHKQNLEDIKAEERAREDAAKANVKINDEFIKAGEQLQEQSQKTQENFDKAWYKYELDTRKAIGITNEAKKTFGELSEISVGLEDRLPAPILAAIDAAVRLQELAKRLGVDLETGLSPAIELFDEFIQRSDVGLPAVLGAWSRISSEIAKLARTNLPEAVNQYRILLDEMEKRGAPLGQLLQLQEDMLEVIIREKTIRGEAANAQIIDLEKIHRQQEKLIDQTQRWGMLYQDIRGIVDSFLDQIGPTLVNSLWGNEENDRLDKQAEELRAGLKDAAAEFAAFGESNAREMEESRKRIAASLEKELADLEGNLAEKGQAYAEYQQEIAAKLEQVRSDIASELDSDLADLQDKLSEKESAYEEYYDDVQEKIQRLIDDDAEALSDQLDNLRDALRDKTQAYEDYVLDVNTKLGRIDQDTEGDIQDQTLKTERNIADKNKDYDREEQDTLARIDKLLKAGKKENDAEVQDLRKSLYRKKQDRDEYNRRQREDLARYTNEHKKAAERQRTDLKTNLEQRTRDYKEYIAENAEDTKEAISDHQEALARQVGDLRASLAERQQALLDYRAEVAKQSDGLREEAAAKLAGEEADLMASLARKTAEYEKYKAEVALKAESLRSAAAAELAQEEADLAASLAKKVSAYEQYKLDIAAKLEEIKEAHKSVWDDISEMIIGKDGVLNKIANSVASVLLKPLTTFASDLAGKALESFLESTVGKAITGFFDKVFESIFGAAASAGGSAAGGAIGGAGSAAGGVAGAVGGAAASGLSGWISAISGVVTSLASVGALFQGSETNTTLDTIGKHTLQTANDLANLRRDEWDRETHLMLKLDDMWRTMLNIYDFMGRNLTAPLQVAWPEMATASGVPGTRADVTVNALDPSARSTTKALVRGLEEVGIKVR